ncbi:unnamed protein product [Heterobilharzia americana]|nr:unnamed protein product [Heterobilharzia americana]
MWVWCNRKSSETWLKCMKGKRKDLSQNNLNYHHPYCGDAFGAGGVVDNSNHRSKVDPKVQSINAACCTSRGRCGVNSHYTGNTAIADNSLDNSGQVMGSSSHCYLQQHHHHQQQHGVLPANIRNALPSGSFALSSGTGSCASAVPISHCLGTMDISLLNSNKSNYCTHASQRQTVKTRPTNIGIPDF